MQIIFIVRINFTDLKSEMIRIKVTRSKILKTVSRKAALLVLIKISKAYDKTTIGYLFYIV